MRISYYLTAEDFMRFSFHRLRHLPSTHKDFKSNRLAGALVIPIAAVVTASLIHYRLSSAAIALAVSSIFAVYTWVTFPKTYDRNLSKKIQSTFEDVGHGGLAGQYWLDLTADGLVEYSEGHTEMIAWNRIGQVSFDGARLFIYFSAIQALIVPLSAFREAAEYAAFVANLRAGTRQPLAHLNLDGPPSGHY